MSATPALFLHLVSSVIHNNIILHLLLYTVLYLSRNHPRNLCITDIVHLRRPERTLRIITTRPNPWTLMAVETVRLSTSLALGTWYTPRFDLESIQHRRRYGFVVESAVLS